MKRSAGSIVSCLVVAALFTAVAGCGELVAETTIEQIRADVRSLVDSHDEAMTANGLVGDYIHDLLNVDRNLWKPYTSFLPAELARSLSDPLGNPYKLPGGRECVFISSRTVDALMKRRLNTADTEFLLAYDERTLNFLATSTEYADDKRHHRELRDRLEQAGFDMNRYGSVEALMRLHHIKSRFYPPPGEYPGYVKTEWDRLPRCRLSTYPERIYWSDDPADRVMPVKDPSRDDAGSERERNNLITRIKRQIDADSRNGVASLLSNEEFRGVLSPRELAIFFYTATWGGRWDAAAGLLLHGADPLMLKAKYRNHCVNWARRYATNDVSELLTARLGEKPWESRAFRHGGWELHFACREGRADVAERIIEKGFDFPELNPNKENPFRSPSHYLRDAVHSGNVRIVELLLDAGASTDRDALTRDCGRVGKGILWSAVGTGEPPSTNCASVVKLLLERGARVKCWQLVRASAWSGQPEAYYLLKEALLRERGTLEED